MANTKNLKPFKKGHDPRRNLKGRPPANSAELNKLIDEIFAEEVEIGDGKAKMSKLRIAINRLLAHNNPMGTVHLLDRRYGKVSEKIDLTNSDGSLKPEEMTPSAIAARAEVLVKHINKTKHLKSNE